MTVAEIKNKYRIEFRAETKPYKWTAKVSCVIFDKETNDYIYDENNPRKAMKRFYSVEAALDYLEERNKACLQSEK